MTESEAKDWVLGWVEEYQALFFWVLRSAPLTFMIYFLISLCWRLSKFVLTPSTVRNTLVHLLLCQSSLASMTPYIARSTIGPTFANIFVGYYESNLFQTTSKPEMYYRYLDDTFVVFSNEDECDFSLGSHRQTKTQC